MNAFVKEIIGFDFYFKHALGRSELHGEEFHDHDEIVFCLCAGVRLVSKNVKLDLPMGSMVLIPREHFHHFIYQNEERYLRCILHYKGQGETSMLMRDVTDGVRVVLFPGEHSKSVFMHLIRCAEHGISKEDGESLLRSAFTSLLIDEKLFGKGALRGETASDITLAAMDFIDANYSKPITLSDIAEGIGVSVSTLSHVFSRELSIPVYKYVTEKRLSAVRVRLSQGMSLGEAAISSGFPDYSVFYRLYKNKYGTSPSGRHSRKI